MSRYLFVVPPLVGHVNPAVGTAAALAARGHDIAWAGPPELVRRLAGPEAHVFPCVPSDSVPGHAAEIKGRTAELKGPAAFQFLWESFLIPLADDMAPRIRAAIEKFGPDVVVADQQTVAGGIVAESLGLTWVTSATTSAELVNPLAGMPRVAAWLDGLLEALRGRIADGRGTADPRTSPHGVLAYTTRALLGPVELPEHVWLVGPSLADRPAPADFPWEWLEGADRTVLVSLGTANADATAPFLNAAVQALSGMAGVRAVIVDPAGCVSGAGENILLRRHVPQLPLLAHVDAAVCHAGHNTVCESLWHGVPLVVAPIRDDQPIVAGQVTAAGAGVRLRFGRADARRIADAVGTVLNEAAGHREAARAVGRSFRAAGGSETAADHLEALLRHSPPVPGSHGQGREPQRVGTQ
ncbi:glycosyltransferase [Streptomyces sp. NBC_00257]|uniref:glycosyltransferase n=1 Tax=unclassified Streptomyces TaxID=2593676 RepID=UPI00224E2BF4|nr:MULTISPECIES: glycosyltransferase [unclassified Streptomyces]WTB59463.1 glycosyltransferase [Streptomyces sp. NBC_00826]WTH87668.1 glycosyltransferase [Streptomyces sp. NBC_00825]WTH96394.1 glycosyltransferase [Streptomyces sp. NBC_00822]MCX4869851.1 glycosyltransferase [Streptomyces sp. NBC_00906]MCX4901014.1 glycosyltransferase [Streptomyces sp. NBC_00892]